MNPFENLGSIEAQGGGGYPPGGYGPPGGGQPPGGWGPPGGPPPGAPPGGGQPPGGWGPPGGPPPGAPPGGGQPPGGWGPPGGPPPGAPPGGGQPPGGWGPPGGPPPGAPPGGGQPPGGWGPPGGPPPGGYGPPGAPPGGGGYGPPGQPPGGGYGGPPGAPPGGGGYGGPPGAGGYGAPPGGGYGAPPGGGGYNPPPQYAPPGGGFQPPPYQPGGPLPGGGEFQGTEAIGFGWNAVTKDFAGVALPIAVAVFVVFIPNFVLGFIRGIVVGGLTASGSDPMLITLLNAGGGIVTWLVGALVQAYMMGGLFEFALGVARGQKPEFGVVFGGGRFLIPLLGATLLYQLAGGIGLAFCIIPGLYLLAALAPYPGFVVDKNMGAIDSLSASWAATAPYRMNVIIYGILAFFVWIAGLLACFVGALLVSAPVLVIANAYMYMKLTGEQPRLASG